MLVSDRADDVVNCLDALASQRIDSSFSVTVVVTYGFGEAADAALRHPVTTRVGVCTVTGEAPPYWVGASLVDCDILAYLTAACRPAEDWLAKGLRAVIAGADAVVTRKVQVPGGLASLVIAHDAFQSVQMVVSGPDTDLIDVFCGRARLAGLHVEQGGEELLALSPRRSRPLPTALTKPPLPRLRGRTGVTARSKGQIDSSLLTVVVCTGGARPQSLARCLDSLRRLDDDNFEVVVVDNSGRRKVDPKSLQDFRHIHEPRGGLDVARNRGAREARGDLIAFVDDDCEVSEQWLRALRSAFGDTCVSAVTGRVVPARLDQPQQQAFEARFSFDRGLEPARFTLHDVRPWFPLFPASLGTGCNMAFRRRDLLDLPGFDHRLDMGTLIGGGGDLDMFAQLLDSNRVVGYAPDAVVFHFHRETWSALRTQFWGYGMTQGALCCKWALGRSGHRRESVRFLIDLLRRKRRDWMRSRSGDDALPSSLIAIEIAGVAVGPIAYLISRAVTSQ